MLALLLLPLLLQPSDRPITCTIVSRNIASCATRNPLPECQRSKAKYCRSVVMNIRDPFWEQVFSEWMWQVADHPSHWNFPLVRERPKVGTKVKAVLDANGQIVPLASCEVRIHRRVNEWSRAHPGERVPLTVMEPPRDCP